MFFSDRNDPKRLSHAQLMDRVYRNQRHFYDFTRKWYLLGRDRVIDSLACLPAETTVLEAGCGTGRNLLRATRVNPGLRCYGIDASAEMLATAARRTNRRGFAKPIIMRWADIVEFDPAADFGRQDFDQIICSYTLSMVPQWREALSRLTDSLAPGGRIQIIDFGMQQGHYPAARKILRIWLRWFHVRPCDELPDVFSNHCSLNGLTQIEVQQLCGGYAVLMSACRPAG